jgi:hypothetical protein
MTYRSTYSDVLAIDMPEKEDDETDSKGNVQYFEGFVKSCADPWNGAQDHQRKREFQDDPRQL